MRFADQLFELYDKLKRSAEWRIRGNAAMRRTGRFKPKAELDSEAENLLHDTLIRCMDIHNRQNIEIKYPLQWCRNVMDMVFKEQQRYGPGKAHKKDPQDTFKETPNEKKQREIYEELGENKWFDEKYSPINETLKILEETKADHSQHEIESDTLGTSLPNEIFELEGKEDSLLASIRGIRLNSDILNCLKALSKNAQQAFLLNTVLGYKGSQIAHYLNANLDAVQQTLARGRKNMGACITEKMELL